MWQNFLQKWLFFKTWWNFVSFNFQSPKSFASSFFSLSFFSPQFSIYRKFHKCFKALIGDMFVKDFQLGENCHKTKSVSKLAKIH